MFFLLCFYCFLTFTDKVAPSVRWHFAGIKQKTYRKKKNPPTLASQMKGLSCIFVKCDRKLNIFGFRSNKTGNLKMDPSGPGSGYVESEVLNRK